MRTSQFLLLSAFLASHVTAEMELLPAPEDSGAGTLFYASLDKERRAKMAWGQTFLL
ncbi:MAG: hypothetical protein QF473_19515 [Planctomycetota bacterium]|nr:hypothetical protein [Planctomycetota bacterium]